MFAVILSAAKISLVDDNLSTLPGFMPDSIPTSDSDNELPQVTNLSQSSVESVKAELVRMNQSLAQQISADEVELHLSAAAELKTDRIEAHESALGLVNAREASLDNSGAVAVRTETLIANGVIGAAIAGTANLGNTYAGVVAGREVRGERIETLVLFGNHVEGEVHTLLDARSALIAGLLGGLFGGVLFLLVRGLFRRD